MRALVFLVHAVDITQKMASGAVVTCKHIVRFKCVWCKYGEINI